MPFVKTFGKAGQRGLGRNLTEFYLPPITLSNVTVAPESISSTFSGFSQSRTPTATGTPSKVFLIDRSEGNSLVDTNSTAKRFMLTFSGQGLSRANRLQLRRFNANVFDLPVESTSDMSSTFQINTANWGRAWLYTVDGTIRFIFSRDGYQYFGGPETEGLYSDRGPTHPDFNPGDFVTARVTDGFYGGTSDLQFRIHVVPQWNTDGIDQGNISGYLYNFLPLETPTGGTVTIIGEAYSGYHSFSEPSNSLAGYDLSLNWTLGDDTATITGQDASSYGGYFWFDETRTQDYNIYVVDAAVPDFSLWKRRRFRIIRVGGFGPYFERATNNGNDLNPGTYDFGTYLEGNSPSDVYDLLLTSLQGSRPYLKPYLPYTSGYTFTQTGTIPSGMTFQTNDDGWELTGTLNTVSSDTTYNWTVKAFNVGYQNLPGYPSSTYWVDTYGARSQSYSLTVETAPLATLGVSGEPYPVVTQGTGVKTGQVVWRTTFTSPYDANMLNPCQSYVSGSTITVRRDIQLENNSEVGGGINKWFFTPGKYSNYCQSGNDNGTQGIIRITRVSRTSNFNGTITEEGDFPQTNGETITYEDGVGTAFAIVVWDASFFSTVNGTYQITWVYDVVSVNVTRINVIMNISVIANVT